MCRIAAYIGDSTPLAELLYRAPHSLEEQAYRPRSMVSGTVNVDGTGVAWWPHGEDTPLRYVTELAPWTDPNLPLLAPRLTGDVILATVRSATPGIGGGSANVHPFVHGPLAGSHNGYLGSFREATAAACLREVPDDLIGSLETVSDARMLFLLAVAAWRRDPEHDLGGAAVDAVARAARICEAAGAEASLNLVLADRHRVCAVRCARGVEPNTLHVRRPGGRWPAGLAVASEPLDDGDWEEVAPDHLVTLDRSGATVAPAQFEVRA